MKKFIKWTLIILAALFSLILAAGLIMNLVGYDPAISQKKYQASTKRIMAKANASLIYTQIMMYQIEHDRNPDLASFEAMVKKVSSGPYQIGTIETDETIKSFCPDCSLAGQKFKVAFYGNIDDDEELDIITVDDKKQMLLIKDDLEEQKVPVDISPKPQT